MKDNIHQELTSELNQTTRTDTITVIVGVVLNLIFLLVNSTVASGVWTEEYNYKNAVIDPMRIELAESETIITTEFHLSTMLIFIILIAAIIAINVFVIKALQAGKERRKTLAEGIQKLYKEEDLDKYYSPSIIKGYETRYDLYTKIVGVLASLSVLIPIVVLTM